MDRMPIAHDEFGSEIDDWSTLDKDELQNTLAELLGAQITSATFEPRMGCLVIGVATS